MLRVGPQLPDVGRSRDERIGQLTDLTTSSPTSCRPSAEGVLCDLDTLVPGGTWWVTVKTTVTAAKGTLTPSAGIRR